MEEGCQEAELWERDNCLYCFRLFVLCICMLCHGGCVLEILSVVTGLCVLSNCGHSFLYHVEQHLRQLWVFIEIDKVWQVVVHLKCNSCFLVEAKRKSVKH